MAFVGAERMTRTTEAGQIHNARGADAAMLALVFGLLGSLIQGVLAFACARRVAETGCRRQAGDASGFSFHINVFF